MLVKLENMKVNSEVKNWKDRMSAVNMSSTKTGDATIFSNYLPVIRRKQIELTSLTPIRHKDNKVHEDQIKHLFEEVKKKRNMTKQECRKKKKGSKPRPA